MRRDPLRLAVSRSSRLLVGAAVGVLAAGLAASPALAEDATPDPSASETGSGAPSNIGPQTPGTPACTLQAAQDKVVGIVAAGAGYVVVEGYEDPNNITLFTLDPTTCAATPTQYSTNPLDIRDLTVGSDGSFYTLDGGDPDHKRATIALEKLPAGGGQGHVYRFKFPDNAKLEANAVVMLPGDIPLFFAVEPDGTTGLYTVSAMPPADNQNSPGQLTKAGTFTATATGTPAGITNLPNVVTGAAKSPDGTKVVIRTYSDAYEYEVGAEGITAAILNGQPVITPLPNEPRGEAITYSADGTQFVTAGFGGGPLLTYTPYVIPELPVLPTNTGGGSDEGGGFLGRFSMSELTKIIAAVGVVGLVLAIAGIIGIRRARRRREEEDEYDDYDDYDDEPRRGRGRGGRGRDRGYGRESAYAGAGYDEGYGGYDQGYGGGGYGGGGYGGGYDQGYGGPGGYDQGYGQGGGYGGYDQGYGGQGGYEQPGYDQGYDQGGGYGQGGYGGQGGGYGGYDQGYGR